MKMKKIVTAAIVAGIIGTMGFAYAATTKTPADILSGLTGKSAGELYTQKSEGTTFGAIAASEGKLDEFKSAMLEQRKAALDERVSEGKLTQEQADAIYSRMQSNQASCDGTGSGRAGRQGGGCGAGAGAGGGCRGGAGGGMGLGQGMSRR